MVKELLVHSDVSITMTYTHALNVIAGGIASPLDALLNQTLEGRLWVVLRLLGLQRPTAGMGTLPSKTSGSEFT